MLQFCTHIYLDNFYNPIEFQGHRSKVKVTWVFGVFLCAWYSRLPANST